MISAWCNGDVIMHSQHLQSHVSKVGPASHVTNLEPSRIEAEPSREPRGRILCSRVYVQSDLRLNLSRWSGQNCFDQILVVWSAIWAIQDMFLANLIIPDAMVWSDRWDSRPKNASGELLKRDCPIKRHLRVMMEVDEDEEEEGAHVYPITRVELLNGDM